MLTTLASLKRRTSTATAFTLVGGLALTTSAYGHADKHSINDDALAEASNIVDCTLENGEASKCASYVVKYLPDSLKIGPFCPSTLEDKGGIWHWVGDKPGLYRIDGDFLKMLDSQGYTFFNETGEVYSFDIRKEGPTESNECIEGSVDPEVKMTLLIPANPVMADEPTSLETVSKVGIGLDGVPIFGDAPSVLDTGHMPALDTCGGHVDPGGWYHWHATASDVNATFKAQGVDSRCENVKQDQTAQFGYAFDGFAMYGTLNYDGSVPDDLDECGGHVGLTEKGGKPVYHYHATNSFPNLPKCLVGVFAKDNFSTNASGGLGSANGRGGPGGPGGGAPDFDAIAKKLGVDAKLLAETLKDAGGRNADLNVVAEKLNISVDVLQKAIPNPKK